MNRNFTLRLAGLFLILLLFSTQIIAQDSPGLTTRRLNVRAGAGTQFVVLVTLPESTNVALLGRNFTGDWLLVRPVDMDITGWVAGTFVSLPNGLDVMSLPFSDGQETPVDPTLSDQSEAVVMGSGNGRTISNLNIRSGPGTEHTALAQIPAGTDVVIESRTEVGDWIIIHSLDGGLRGWVIARYVNFDDDVSIHLLPISSDTVNQTSLAGSSGSTDETSIEETSTEAATETTAPEIPIIDRESITLPQGTSEELTQRLKSVPLFYNFNTPIVYETFELGKEMGNRPNVFMLVGDSVTAAQPFMTGYSVPDNYDLGDYEYLEDTINYFRAVSPRAGIANSFVNSSFAAFTGGTSNSMLSQLWADPTFCVGEIPLSCEIKLTHPGVGLVLFGTQDMRIIDAFDFRIYMSQLVEYMLNSGVIPVLSTFHNNPSYYGEDAVIFNNVIVDVAETYQVPLINLWVATQPLPDNGVLLDDPVHLSMGWDNFYDFTGDENLYGVNLRNLLSLQALDQLRKTVLQG